MKKTTVRLTTQIINDLNYLSTKHNQSISFIIRTILEDYIKYYKLNNKINNEKN